MRGAGRESDLRTLSGIKQRGGLGPRCQGLLDATYQGGPADWRRRDEADFKAEASQTSEGCTDLDQPGRDRRRPALPRQSPAGRHRGRRPPGGAMSGETAVDAALAFAESSPETSRSRTLVWQDPVPTAAAGATM